MLIEHKIKQLEKELVELREQWKKASPAMKLILEEKGKNKQSQLGVFRTVLRKRATKLALDKQQPLV